MKDQEQHRDSGSNSHRLLWRVWIVLMVCGLIVLIGLLTNRHIGEQTADRLIAPASAQGETGSSHAGYSGGSRRARAALPAKANAEEIVASKLQQFGRNRRELIHALAKHF